MEISRAPHPAELAGDLAATLERVVTLLRSLNTVNVMSRTAFSTLGALERNGPARLTALAAREGVTQPAMTQLISRLEGSGLVRREADPSDGRVVQVVITDAGLETIAQRRAERAELLTALLAKLSPEHQTALAAALPALQALAAAHDSQPAIA